MPNQQLLLKLVKQLIDYLEKLEEFKTVTAEDFNQDWKIYWAIDHGLHLSIQTCIDIGKEIISALQLSKPRQYKETFLILSRNKIISYDLAEKMIQLVEFRNRLIHEYLFTDPIEIYQIYKNKRLFFYDFIREVSKFIKYRD